MPRPIIVLLVLAVAALPLWYATRLVLARHRTLLLPGQTSYGHRLIQESCFSCHVPWSGVGQQSCLGCHRQALEAVNDTHAAARFDDPVNAAELQRLNVTLCTTCHREHRPAITDASSSTVAKDFCVVCHLDVLSERPSHRGFGAAGCSASGCHHYHDNRALYTDLLRRHKHDPDLSPPPRVVPSREPPAAAPAPLIEGDADAPAPARESGSVAHEWARSEHARARVNCSACHQPESMISAPRPWEDRPGFRACVRCHTVEAAAFSTGRHGMRDAVGLAPLTPSMATLPMRPDAAHRAVTCAVCHAAHALDIRSAAVEACESCHADEHTHAYRASAHFALWAAERKGTAPPGSGVSCATCHMPRVVIEEGGRRSVHADHDQSRNLRPSEAMALDVCRSCHGLPFSLAALADATLVRRNFNGTPRAGLTGMDLVGPSKDKGEPTP
jgi:hypothetical protein